MVCCTSFCILIYINSTILNTYTSPAGAKINFRAFESATLENYEEKIQILKGGDIDAVIETIKKSGKDPQQQIKQTIYNAIAPQLTEVKAQSAYKEQTDKSGLPTFTIGGETAPAAPAQPAQQSGGVSLNKQSSLGNVVSNWLQTPEGSLENQTAEESASKFAREYGKRNPVTRGDNRSAAQIKEDNKKLSKKERLENAGQLGKDIFNTIGQAMSVKEAVLNEIKKQTLSLNQPAQQTSVETTDDSGLPTFTIGEDVIGTPAQQAEAQQKIDSLEDQINQAISDANSEDLRVKINQEIDMFEPENWTEVESWLKKNFPNVPVYRVKNIIQATNGRQAWGMFKDGAIYVYENVIS